MTTTSTVNYNFLKPDVGSEIDTWGPIINTDLNSIDTQIKNRQNEAAAAQALAVAALPKAGGTMTGPIVLPGDPTLALQATTKQYVDAAAAAITVPANTIQGNNTGATGPVLSLTATQATAALNVMATSLKGLVPAPSASPSATKFLTETGVFAVPPNSTFVEYNLGVVVASGGKIQAHGLAAYPRGAAWYLECTTTNAGYAVGDRVEVGSLGVAGSNQIPATYMNITNVGMSFSSDGLPAITTKGGGVMIVITAGSWKVIVRVFS